MFMTKLETKHQWYAFGILQTLKHKQMAVLRFIYGYIISIKEFADIWKDTYMDSGNIIFALKLLGIYIYQIYLIFFFFSFKMIIFSLELIKLIVQ